MANDRLVPFSWKVVDRVFDELGYSCSVSDGNHLYKYDGKKLNTIVEPHKDEIDDKVCGLEFTAVFGLEEVMMEDKTLCLRVVDAINNISSFCSVALSASEENIFIRSYLPVRSGICPGHLRQVLAERDAVVFERASKMLALLVK